MFIQSAIPLASKNWFQTGGIARFFCQPATTAEFQEALTFARNNTYELFVLGQGANILMSDEGFDGLVIQPHLTKITLLSEEESKIVSSLPLKKQNDSEAFMHAGAGSLVSDCIDYALAHNLCGLEEFSGIPGSVGGSVFINIHYFNFLLSQFLAAGEIINKRTGEVLWVTPEWFTFGYNSSQLHSGDYFLLSAIFRLQQKTSLEAAFAQGRRHEMIRHRAHRYPTSHTCGSFFRNFSSAELAATSASPKVPYIAYYLDSLGIKGSLAVGGARVSHRHANMIVNEGSATSADIITLARTMQERVFAAYGLLPQPECQLIGFKQYPLLTSC